MKLQAELISLVQVRNTARMQANAGPLADRLQWKAVFKAAVRCIKLKEQRIAVLMPSGVYQRELDLRKP